MLQSLLNVFRITELRNKVLFTLAMLIVFRVGHWIPVPGVNHEALDRMFRTMDTDSVFGKVAGMVSMFSGGALSHSTIFGLGIMPYITAGIIFQLVSSVPGSPLKKLQEEGPTGRQKVQEYTRYAAVGLAIIQGMGWLSFLRARDMVYLEWASNPVWWVMALTTLAAGSVFLMWLGEQIDRHGIGNGASLIITAGILGGMPGAINSVRQSFNPDGQGLGWMGLIMLGAGFVLVVAGSVIMTVAQRRIPIQQAKHTRGRKVFGGQRSYLPLRVNHGGVMPIIFASSLMVFPSLLFAQIGQLTGRGGVLGGLVSFFGENFNPGEYLYILAYIAMVYFFSYFWITVQFNPEEMSKQLKEHGSFIPGLRPGPRTAEYLETVMNRVTFVGAAFLSVVAILPVVINKSMGVDYMVTQFFGGTGLLIVVSVTMDFLQRVDANLLMRNYAGLLGGGEEAKGPRMKGPRF